MKLPRYYFLPKNEKNSWLFIGMFLIASFLCFPFMQMCCQPNSSIVTVTRIHPRTHRYFSNPWCIKEKKMQKHSCNISAKIFNSEGVQQMEKRWVCGENSWSKHILKQYRKYNSIIQEMVLGKHYLYYILWWSDNTISKFSMDI